MEYLGRALLVIGALLVLVGVGLLFRHEIPGANSLLRLLGSLGRLPGDIVIENERTRFYLPITTSLLISAVLSLLFWLLRKGG